MIAMRMRLHEIILQIQQRLVRSARIAEEDLAKKGDCSKDDFVFPQCKVVHPGMPWAREFWQVQVECEVGSESSVEYSRSKGPPDFQTNQYEFSIDN